MQSRSDESDYPRSCGFAVEETPDVMWRNIWRLWLLVDPTATHHNNRDVTKAPSSIIR
jgi:hypothetical protein